MSKRNKYTIKNIVCKRFNENICPIDKTSCDYLHICVKCKKNHSYLDCTLVSIRCPICDVNLLTMKDYITHILSKYHCKKVSSLRRIFSTVKKKKIKTG